MIFLTKRVFDRQSTEHAFEGPFIKFNSVVNWSVIYTPFQKNQLKRTLLR